MRRKKDTLIPIEISILHISIDLAMSGKSQFYGFMLAKEMKDRDGAKLLIARGTLYKALDRLQRWGFLESEWEDPLIAAREQRPRRRFYWITPTGQAALVDALEAEEHAANVQPQPRTATS